jgi:NAD(P)-dependent dehydrogenase (short-subunit alcohol dehydrogenase family)
MTDARTLLVTGGSRGIGAATSKLAAARGWAVAVNFHDRADAAREVVAEIERHGGRAQAIKAEVSDEGAVEKMFRDIDKSLPPLGGLFNNAGITGPLGRLENTTAAAVRRVFDVNVVGSFLCAREAVRRLSTLRGGKGGAIVNMSSAAARLGGPGEWLYYGASKGAIDTFTAGLAKEVAREGIRVNAVRPGMIDTEIHAAAGDPERCARIGPTVPMGRVGTAEEVAETVLWLLSPAASYVTGALVDVSGGR